MYENCSRNVDTFTEFCSGYATLTGEKKIYNREEDRSAVMMIHGNCIIILIKHVPIG